MPAQTIDDAHTRLHAAGWSVGDIATLDLAGRRAWNVYLHRNEQRIVSQAPTQAEALLGRISVGCTQRFD